jgi:hypothetical protein
MILNQPRQHLINTSQSVTSATEPKQKKKSNPAEQEQVKQTGTQTEAKEQGPRLYQ